MVIGNFHVKCVTRLKSKTNSLLIIDANAPLVTSISRQFFKPIAGRNTEYAIRQQKKPGATAFAPGRPSMADQVRDRKRPQLLKNFLKHPTFRPSIHSGIDGMPITKAFW